MTALIKGGGEMGDKSNVKESLSDRDDRFEPYRGTTNLVAVSGKQHLASYWALLFLIGFFVQAHGAVEPFDASTSSTAREGFFVDLPDVRVGPVITDVDLLEDDQGGLLQFDRSVPFFADAPVYAARDDGSDNRDQKSAEDRAVVDDDPYVGWHYWFLFVLFCILVLEKVVLVTLWACDFITLNYRRIRLNRKLEVGFDCYCGRCVACQHRSGLDVFGIHLYRYPKYLLVTRREVDGSEKSDR